MPELIDLLDQVDEMRDEIVALERDMVRIPTVNTGFMPTGNETELCRYVERWLAEDGVACEVIESAPGRGNLIARLEGASGKAGLMFMSHLDVVPVEEEEKWRFPPFSATVADGRVYGRGASDCKGLLTCHLVALRILKRNGVRLRDSLILASCADEEHGGRYGFGWMAEHHPEKLAAPLAVNEGGGYPVHAAGNLTYLLGVGEKGRLQVEIDVRGSSAHASVPWLGSNALFVLSEVVKRIEAYEPERDTSTSLFEHLSVFAIEDKPSAENVDQIIADTRDENPRFASTMRALSRMTITPTMVRGGIKSNSVPESVRLTCDVRTLPHQGRSLRPAGVGEDPRRVTGGGDRHRLHGGPQFLAVRDRLRPPHPAQHRPSPRTRRRPVGPRADHRLHRLPLHPRPGHNDLRHGRLPPR